MVGVIFRRLADQLLTYESAFETSQALICESVLLKKCKSSIVSFSSFPLVHVGIAMDSSQPGTRQKAFAEAASALLLPRVGCSCNARFIPKGCDRGRLWRTDALVNVDVV